MSKNLNRSDYFLKHGRKKTPITRPRRTEWNPPESRLRKADVRNDIRSNGYPIGLLKNN